MSWNWKSEEAEAERRLSRLDQAAASRAAAEDAEAARLAARSPAEAAAEAEFEARSAAEAALRPKLDAALAALGYLTGLEAEHNGAELSLALPGRGSKFLRVALDSAHLRALLAAQPRDRASLARSLVNRHGETPSPWDY